MIKDQFYTYQDLLLAEKQAARARAKLAMLRSANPLWIGDQIVHERSIRFLADWLARIEAHVVVIQTQLKERAMK